MPKPKSKIARTHPTKEVSVMAWIEDAEQKVLFVRQALGLRLWTLPGGKVKRGESLVKALRPPFAMSMRLGSRRVAHPQHGMKCGFQWFMNKQTERAEGDDD